MSLRAKLDALRAAAVEARRYALTLSTLEIDVLECIAEGVTDPDDMADACDRHRNECTRVVQHLQRRGMVRDGAITQDGRDALAYSLQAMDNDQ